MTLVNDFHSYLLPSQDVSGQLHLGKGTLAVGPEELVVASMGLLLSRDGGKP